MDCTTEPPRDAQLDQVVEIAFPDGYSQGVDPVPNSTALKSARSAFSRLAKNTASTLKTSLKINETKSGLSLTFGSHSEAQRVFAAMKPHWKSALLDGLEGSVCIMKQLANLTLESHGYGAARKFVRDEMTIIADGYGLDLDFLLDHFEHKLGYFFDPQPRSGAAHQFDLQKFSLEGE